MRASTAPVLIPPTTNASTCWGVAGPCAARSWSGAIAPLGVVMAFLRGLLPSTQRKCHDPWHRYRGKPARDALYSEGEVQRLTDRRIGLHSWSSAPAAPRRG